MKRIVLFLLIAGLVMFGGFLYSRTQRGDAAAVAPEKPADTTRVVMAKSSPAPKVRRVLTPEERRELEASLLEKQAQLTTPEEARRYVTQMLARWEPGHQALFKAWDLDEATAREVRQMLYDRELEQELWILKPEASRPGTHLASSEEKRGRRYLADSAIADLVGAERFKQLRQVEEDARVALERQAAALRD